MSTAKAIGDDNERVECENFSLSMKKFVCLTVDTCHVFYFVSEKADFWVLQAGKKYLLISKKKAEKYFWPAKTVFYECDSVSCLRIN